MGKLCPRPYGESSKAWKKTNGTNITQSVPISPPNLGPLWSFFGKGGSAQWQWEAPSAPKSNDQPAAVLPPWLLEWDTPPDIALDLEDTEDSTRALVSIEEDIVNFQVNASGYELP